MENKARIAGKTLKKNNEEELALSNIKRYYKSSIIKIAQCWHMNLQISGTEQKESPENRHR